MVRIPSLTLVLLVAAATAAHAQFPSQPQPPQCFSLFQGTDQERAACHGDVVKFCKAELAANQCDTFAILGCLQRNRDKISNACQEVLRSHGQ